MIVFSVCRKGRQGCLLCIRCSFMNLAKQAYRIGGLSDGNASNKLAVGTSKVKAYDTLTSRATWNPAHINTIPFANTASAKLYDSKAVNPLR